MILDRAEAALGMEWHQAVPVVRVFDVTDNNSTTSSRVNVYDVEIHTHSAECYVPIEGYPRTFQLEIGYRGSTGTFFKLAQSRKVSSVKPRKRDVRPLLNDVSASEEKGYGYVSEMAPRTHSHASAMVVDAIRAQRTRADSANLDDSIQTNGEQGNGRLLNFHVDAELAIHGKALPFSELTLMGEPVSTASDGSFSVRFALEEGRQVIPAVMLTADGSEQHTVVLAIERNTKQLEPRSMNEPL